MRSTAATGCFYFFGELRSDVLCPLVSLVVTHTVMFTHVSLYLQTFIMVYTRNGQDVVVYWYNIYIIHTYHTMYNVSKYKEPRQYMCCIHVHVCTVFYCHRGD